MIRNVLIIWVILLNVFLYFDFAFPCTCAPPGTPMEELEKSDVVFKAVHVKELIETAQYASVEEIEKINAVKLWESTPWPLM